jgi:RHS repeat-associated protein
VGVFVLKAIVQVLMDVILRMIADLIRSSRWVILTLTKAIRKLGRAARRSFRIALVATTMSSVLIGVGSFSASASVVAPPISSNVTPALTPGACPPATLLPTPAADTLAYAAESSANQVQVIDEATGSTYGSPIPVGTTPSGVGYWEPFAGSSHYPEVLVANSGSNNVTVINATTQTVVTTISLPSGSNPSSVAASWIVPYAFVVDRGTGKISVLSLQNNTDLGEITLSGSANTLAQAAFQSLGSYGYVTDPSQHKIYELGPTTTSPYFSLSTTYTNSSYDPNYIAVNYANAASPSLVVSSTLSSSGAILEFNDGSGTFTAPVNVVTVSTYVPEQIAWDGGNAWVALNGRSSDLEFKVSTGALEENLIISGFTAAGPLALSADRSTLLTADTGSGGVDGFSTTSYGQNFNSTTAAPVTSLIPAYPELNFWNAVVITAGNGANNINVLNTGFNTAYNSIVQTFTEDNNPIAVAASPDGQYVYIANTDSISVVQTSLIGVATNPVVATIAMPQNSSLGNQPHVPQLNGIAVSPSGDALLVTDYANGAVDVVKTVPGSPTSDSEVAEIGLLGSGISSSQVTGGYATFSPDGLFGYVTESGASSHTNDGVTILSLASGSTWNYGYDTTNTDLVEGSDTLIDPTSVTVTSNDEAVYVEGSPSGSPTTDAQFAFPLNVTSGVSNGTLGSYSSVTPTAWSSTVANTVLDPESQNAYAVGNSSVGAAWVTGESISSLGSSNYEQVDPNWPVSITGGAAQAALSPDGLDLAVLVQQTSGTGCTYGANSIEVFNPANGGLWGTATTVNAPTAIAFIPQSSPDPLTPSQVIDGASNPAEAADGSVNDVVPAGTPSDAPGLSAGVDTATGAYSLSLNSMSLSDLGIDLTQTATYDSTLDSTRGLLGYGWSNSYGVTATQSAYTPSAATSCLVTVTQSNGATVTFTPTLPPTSYSSCSSLTSYQAPGWAQATLTVISSCNGSDSCWVFQLQASTKFEIDQTTGVLVKEVDLYGNTVTLTWGTHGSTCPGALSSEPCQVTGADGTRALTYSYPSPGSGTCPSSANSCVVVTDPIGRTLTYQLNASGDLVAVTLVNAAATASATYVFSYNGANEITSWCDPQNYVNGGTCTSSYATTLTWSTSGQVTKATAPTTSVSGPLPYGSTPTWSFTYTDLDATTGDGSVAWTNPNGNLSTPIVGANTTLDVYQGFELVSTTSGYGPLAAYPTGESPADLTLVPSVTDYPIRDALNLMPSESMDGTAGEWQSYTVGSTTTSIYENGVTQNNYDANGNLLSSTDPNGNTTTNTYNSLDLPVTSTDANGNVTVNTYTSTGLQLTSTSPPNDPLASPVIDPETSNYYTSSGLLCASRTPVEVDLHGVLTSCATTNDTYESYDAAGDLLSTTNPLGNANQDVYDLDGDLCASVTADGVAAGKSLSSCPSAGAPYATVNVTLNPFNTVGETIVSQALTPSYTYETTNTCFNANGDVTAAVGPRGTFSTCGSLSLTSSMFTSWTFQDADGNTYETVAPMAVTGTQGLTSTTAYDADSTAVLSLSPQGYAAWQGSLPYSQYETSTVVANGGGTVSSGPLADESSCTPNISNPCPDTSSSVTNGGGEVTAVATPSTAGGSGTAAVTTSSYNPDGSVAASQSPISGTTVTTVNSYDSDGNQVSSVNETGSGSSTTTQSATATAYNPDGSTCWTASVQESTFSCSSIPAGGVATASYYNLDGQLIAQVGPGGSSTYYPGATYSPTAAFYDSPYPYVPGYFNSADIAPFTTYYLYNEAGQLTKTIEPSANNTTTGYVAAGITTSETYDADGNVHTEVNAAGNTVTNSYDGANELVGVSYSDSSNTISYAYDAAGDRTQMVDSSGTTNYTYDGLDRLISETDANGNTVTYGFNALGQKDCVTYPGASGTCATYTSGTVPSSGSDEVGYTYDSEGRLSSVLDFNGDSFTYGYDCAGDEAWMVEWPESDWPSGGYNPTLCAGSSGTVPSPPTPSTGQTFVETLDSYANGSAGGQLTATTTKAVTSSGSTVLLGFGTTTALSYDDNGNLLSSTPDVRGTAQTADAFNYDTQQRVTQGPTTGSNNPNAYGYANSSAFSGGYQTNPTVDDMGLSLTKPNGGGATSVVGSQYNGAGELCWTEADPTGSMNANSCATIHNSAGGYQTFSYNASGELSSTTPHNSYGTTSDLTWTQDTGTLTCLNPAGSTCTSPSSTNPQIETYLYNGDGLRTQEQFWNGSSTATTKFTWNSSTSALLSDGSFDYLYGANSNLPLAQIDLADSVTDYLLTDSSSNLRGIVEVTSSAASPDALVNYTDYTTTGQPITGAGGSTNAGGLTTIVGTDADSVARFGFGGGYTDATAMVYLVNRYYDPATGQFLGVDPDLKATGTPFAYAGDDPVMNSDDLGLSWWNIWDFLPPRSHPSAEAIFETQAKIAIKWAEVAVDAHAPYYYGGMDNIPAHPNPSFVDCMGPGNGQVKSLDPDPEYYGGENPCSALRSLENGHSGFDCSGLTKWAWAHAGVTLAHFSYTQETETDAVPTPQKLPFGKLIPGDLVFYLGGDHVAIYIGSNEIIQAPETGQVVEITSIDQPGVPFKFGQPRI